MELRPAILDSCGLFDAVKWELREFENRTGIACCFHGPEEAPDLSADQQTALYRIVQEALTNIARHSRATKVDVVADDDGDAVTMDIRDNGIGFHPEVLSNPTSIGLFGIQERARHAGGQCELLTEPGKGVTVRVTAPRTVKAGQA
jgi:signal transduction histidine kinase